jgi:hypothetical protein
MKYFVMAAMIVLCGCPEIPKPLSNEDIIAQVKQCEDGGLTAKPLHMHGMESYPIVAIQCYPKGK